MYEDSLGNVDQEENDQPLKHEFTVIKEEDEGEMG